MRYKNDGVSFITFIIELIKLPFVIIIFLVKKIISLFKTNKKRYNSKQYERVQNIKTQNDESDYTETTYLSKDAIDYTKFKPSKNENKVENSYVSKDSIMSECEKEFFKAFNDIVDSKYIVQPQVNLATIINKENNNKYINELFRNVDFGIFDLSYRLILLIEINDKTHEQASRIARDKKVREICESAGIPIINFWVKYGVNKTYIKDKLKEYLVDLD